MSSDTSSIDLWTGMRLSCWKMTRPKTRPRAHTMRPNASRFQPVMPRNWTLLKSGRTRFISPFGSSAWAPTLTKRAQMAIAALVNVRLIVDVIVIGLLRLAVRSVITTSCCQRKGLEGLLRAANDGQMVVLELGLAGRVEDLGQQAVRRVLVDEDH